MKLLALAATIVSVNAFTASAEETKRPRFGIYMPKLDVCTQTMDVTERGDRLSAHVESRGNSLGGVPPRVRTPWKEIQKVADQTPADLVAMGNVGPSGIKGLLLGNTAEKVLSICPCSLLTVKPDDFVSPIEPASWELHPANATRQSG